MTIRLKNVSQEDCVIAVAVAAKTKVVSCNNPADAASSVLLRAGDYVKPLGQSADYRHDLDSLPAIHHAALVQSWWNNDAQVWETTVDGADAAETEIRTIIRAREDAREAKARAERREKAEAEARAARKSRQEQIESAVALAQQAGEAWAQGRVKARYFDRSQEIIVGRWDAPNTPGYGLPVEVRRAVADAAGVLVLVPCPDSFRYGWM